jgi:hypothetical protein
MKISGFTFIKNGAKLYFPIRQSIESALDIVDEFVVALGDCDPDDKTLEELEKINNPKLKIIHTVWDLKKYSRGTENAHQTDLAKAECSGDWLLYLQGDEVIHEEDHNEIVSKCKQHLNDERVEGLLFKYRHFWGDFDHFHQSHTWYPNEIRIIRNDPEIHSWESAQSFRRIPKFDGVDYRQQAGTFRLKVIPIDAYIYHYGWVRPPSIMVNKKKALDTIHKGKEKANELYESVADRFNYGPLGNLSKFKGSHPKVMHDWIQRHDWADELNYSKTRKRGQIHKHERLKYRLISFIENKLLGGRQLGGFKNYIIIKTST